MTSPEYNFRLLASQSFLFKSFFLTLDFGFLDCTATPEALSLRPVLLALARGFKTAALKAAAPGNGQPRTLCFEEPHKLQRLHHGGMLL